MGNEMSIKVCKFKKTLDILNRSWSNPFNNGLNLAKIHVNDETQEFHFRLMELTLFQFGINFNLSKFFQNQTYMAFMVFHVL
jgi:hypothetical protein